MSKITNLNFGNSQRIQKMLEYNLINYEKEPSNTGKIIIDAIYAFEMEHAEKACNRLDKSLGFLYFMENYNRYEKSLTFFSTKMIDDILNFKENVEGLIHDSFDSFQDFKLNKPRTFLIDLISKYDKDLSTFVEVNIESIKSINSFIDMIGMNWNSYEVDRFECKKLITKLDKYYDEHIIKCPRSDIYVYLFKKNNMINDFRKYYIMEDTTKEEMDDFIENSDIFDYELSIRDIKLIAEMDKIIKENSSKKIKTLKF